jgi:hypothetical protein
MDDAHSHPTRQSPAADDDAAGSSTDSVLTAIAGAVGALRRFSDHTTEILDAFERAAETRETGASYRQIAEDEPLFVEFSSGAFRELYDALSLLRRTQARALYEEGMTMAQLGRLLGVTRQRIAVLLSGKRKQPDD